MKNKKRQTRRNVCPERREFLATCAGAMAIPVLASMPVGIQPATDHVREGEDGRPAAQRVIFMFSPNGVVKDGFWPEKTGEDFELSPVLRPLEPFKDKLLILKGVHNEVRGDGDNHMRGMSCLLTGIELFPGNIQGGSDTPAGWAKGISIDQELTNYFQSREESKTRFGSLEFGVRVPNEATPWSRMVYSGPNAPVAPVSDPYRMFEKMYGNMKEKENLKSVLGLVEEDIQNSNKLVGENDRDLLRVHREHVQQMTRSLNEAPVESYSTPPLQLPADVRNENENMPQLAKMQIDLLINGFENDLNRVASLQFTRSVGNARMTWLGIEEGHHQLSHDPDLNENSQEKLTKINTWYCEQLAYLLARLRDTEDPVTGKPMLDNTLVVWTNELGHGNSHTLQNIPMVLVGGGFGFTTGRYLDLESATTNRLWLTIAGATGHEIETFGKPSLCKRGRLEL